MSFHSARAKSWLASILLAFVAFAPAWAAADGLHRAFDQIVVFGDSLSDPGNAFALTRRNLTPPDYGMQPEDLLVPAFPYARGGNHFSNGPTWIEDLGLALGRASNVGPALRGASRTASNYAVGGARARSVPDEFLAEREFHFALQVEVFLRDVGGHAPSDALYVIMIGGNDVRDGFATASSVPIVRALASIAKQIPILYAAGARKFLILNTPNIARTPTVRTIAVLRPDLPILLLAEQASLGFNAGLSATLTGLSSALPGIEFMRFDTFAAVEDIASRPAFYGLQEVTTACIQPNVPPFQCQRPDRHLFWDGIHPTRAGHAIIAFLVGKTLVAAVLAHD